MGAAGGGFGDALYVCSAVILKPTSELLPCLWSWAAGAEGSGLAVGPPKVQASAAGLQAGQQGGTRRGKQQQCMLACWAELHPATAGEKMGACQQQCHQILGVSRRKLKLYFHWTQADDWKNVSLFTGI